MQTSSQSHDNDWNDIGRWVAGFLRRPAGYVFFLSLLIGISILRITSTYHVLSHTIDEPAHLACGMQWLEKGIYTYESLHPPVSRVSVAIGPYLAGLRGTGNPSMWIDGVGILASGGHYWHNLTLARIGILPYFALATVIVFLWARQLYGLPAGLVAATIFAQLPVVLAHSGVATTDIPFTAFYISAVYAFTLWLAVPDMRTAAIFGIAAGLAISTKFSALVFLPPTMVSILLLYFAYGQRNWRGMARTVGVALICTVFVIWAAYRFSYAPIDQITSAPDKVAIRVFGESSLASRGVRVITAHLQVPAPGLFDGLRLLIRQDRIGRRAYMYGKVRLGGWWYFYLVSIALKTPIAVLLLVAAGCTSLVVKIRSSRDWRILVPVVAALVLVVVTAPSRINIGVRHILPIYAYLSMLAAVGVTKLWNWRYSNGNSSEHGFVWRRSTWAARGLAIGLLAWLTMSSLRAQPDYLSYFNEFVRGNPADVLVISDVDWGQDLARLASYVHQQGIQHISIAYDGVFDAASLDLPAVRLMCNERATGWIAIEERRARVYPECYQWLVTQPMQAYVGKTMRIYYLPEQSLLVTPPGESGIALPFGRPGNRQGSDARSF
jgi:hypothetical protein